MSIDMENETTPNVGELVAIYQHIKTHPEQWHQSYWGMRTEECGTSYCFAGHAAVRAGAEPMWIEGFSSAVDNLIFDDVKTVDGEFREIQDYATELLGLTYGQAEDLFCASNSLEGIRALIHEITGVDPETAEVQS